MYINGQPERHPLKDRDAEFRDLTSKTLQECRKKRGKERAKVAEEVGISLALLNAYCSNALNVQDKNTTGMVSKTRRARFPAALIPAFSKATGSDALQLFVLDDHQRFLLELGEEAFRLISKAARRKQP